MSTRASTGVLGAVLVVLAACKTTPAPAGADGGASVACYAGDQDRCREFPQPSAEQRANLGVECSSGSGKLTSPADCPKAKFVGKCTLAATGKDGPEVRRFYKADDAAYQKDFCATVAKGVWSDSF